MGGASALPEDTEVNQTPAGICQAEWLPDARSANPDQEGHKDMATRAVEIYTHHYSQDKESLRRSTLDNMRNKALLSVDGWKKALKGVKGSEYIKWDLIEHCVNLVGKPVGVLAESGTLRPMLAAVTVEDPDGIPCWAGFGAPPEIEGGNDTQHWVPNGGPRLSVNRNLVRDAFSYHRADIVKTAGSTYTPKSARDIGRTALTADLWNHHSLVLAADIMRREWVSGNVKPTVVETFDLPRAIAWCSRRINDEITLLYALGFEHSKSWERQLERAAEREKRLHNPAADEPGYVAPTWTSWELGLRRGMPARGLARDIAEMQGRTVDEVLDAMSRSVTADFDAYVTVDDPASKGLPATWAVDGNVIAAHDRDHKPGAPDPCDPSLFGYARSAIDAALNEYEGHPIVEHAVGVDFETTGLDNASVYVIDAGWEDVDLTVTDTTADCTGSSESRSYGVSPLRAVLGNPTRRLTAISTESLADHLPLDEDGSAQDELRDALLAAPMVAHSAGFEQSALMMNVRGWAEAQRDGKVKVIDTRKVCRRLDAGKKNDLESYAKRWGALDEDSKERHLGLDDTHIMLVALRNHMASLGLLPGQGAGEENDDADKDGDNGEANATETADAAAEGTEKPDAAAADGDGKNA